MNIQAAKDQVKDTVEAYLAKDDAGMYVIDPVHQRPVFLVGAPGIGKTAIMSQVARELGIGMVSYSMTHHTRQSALGLPSIEEKEFDGHTYKASEYTMSEIVAAIYDYMSNTGLRQGILFLDEINCVSETLYPSMLQFLQFKTFGKHKVPDDWVIVCAGNPPEYNRSVHEFDIVTLDRLREIDVEPDYGVWKNYAKEQGLHPAVTTFLEAKNDCFYKVESKPGGGKSFVTARGWEDLADIIATYEQLGKPVNRDLFAQFLKDEDIADQFAVYYTLFEKYRSDYQVGKILSGYATDAIRKRAKEAEFDERVALLSLLLDAIAGECAKALDQESVVLDLRDVLREVKPELLDGKTVDETLHPRIERRELELARRMDAGIASKAFVRKERFVIGKLRAFAAQCTAEKTPGGDTAFHTLERCYKAEVDKIKPLVDAANEKIDNAFDFVDDCFANREMLVFLAELTTRQTTTNFISHYGNEKYYAHNDELQVDQTRTSLSARIKGLDEDDIVRPIDEVSQSHITSVDMSGAVGFRSGDAQTPVKAEGEITDAELAEYYSGKQFEYGFASMSKMNLLAHTIKGKRVLDVCCRRGKGVYKFSAKIAPGGHVIGTDWNPDYIDDAIAGMDRAWHDNGLKENNMEFRVAFPEKLIDAGIGDGTMEVVYINNVMTLLYDQERALQEFARVLKPGGLLILETIFADRPRDEKVVEAARHIGNSIQAARTQDENFAWLAEAGFGDPVVEEEYDVAANRGFKASHTVETVPGDEDVKYQAVSVYVHKK